MNVTSTVSTIYGGGAPLPQQQVAKRLADYTRRRWSKSLNQLNQYQRQLAVYVLTQHHGFEPKQLVGLLSRSKSQIYADLQAIPIYVKTSQFKADADQMNQFIKDNRPFLYF